MTFSKGIVFYMRTLYSEHELPLIRVSSSNVIVRHSATFSSKHLHVYRLSIVNRQRDG